MKSEHSEISDADWAVLMKKRCYYAHEIAQLIQNLPLDQARLAKSTVKNASEAIYSSPDSLKEYLAKMHNIPELARLILLINKYNENLCCYGCAMSSILAAFLICSIDEKAPNSTLQ